MGMKLEIYPGARIGSWTVLEEIPRADSERKWLCLCDCGTQRPVLDRSLRYGNSMSCGCRTIQIAADKNAHKLIGRRFGQLVVLEPAEPQDSRKGRWWKCRCDCGNEILIPGTLLMTGRKTHCGCKTEKNYAYTDIRGQKFRRLTALYPLKKRSSKGGVIWHCRCDCGNETDVSYNGLVYSHQASCGCRKKEHDQNLESLLAHVDGTSIDHLRSNKVPRNSTTGVKGVYLIHDKYVAKIVFQKKQYFLGTYSTLDAAAQARKDAEVTLNACVVDFYDRWKAKAEADPTWAEQNPMQIFVTRNNAEFQVDFLPELNEFES